MVATIIFGIIGSMLYLSCKSTPTTPPPVEFPTKLLPAYTLDIKYPAEEGSVNVDRGGSVTLPVTVKSLVDEPIKIRLTLTAVDKIPEFVQFETEKEYRTLKPGGTISTEMTITVSENAPLGSFFLGITGKLEEPVKERAGLSMNFTFTVTGS